MAVHQPPNRQTPSTEPPGPALRVAALAERGKCAVEFQGTALIRLVRALARSAAREAVARPDPANSHSHEESE